MAQQTAMQIMYDELIAHEYTIPLDLIIKCKELIDVEKEQIIDAFNDVLAQQDNTYYGTPNLGEQYYNETYNK